MRITRRGRRPTVKVKGIREAKQLFRQTNAFRESLTTSIDRIRREFALSTHRDIVALTPVRTGHLRASNRVNIIGETVQFINLADYAHFVDLGTGLPGARSFVSYIPQVERGIRYNLNWPGMEGTPFMRLPIAKGIERVNNEIRDVIRHISRPPP